MSEQAEDDVNSAELLDMKTLAANRTGFARNALFDRVAGLLFESEGELSPEVRALIDQILTGLIKHVESEIRAKVANRLSSLKTAPLELTRLLANDNIEIALPILHHSPVLTDRDLIAIVETKTPEHREAIAKRPELPGNVCAALAKSKEPKAVEALLANMGAVIPREVFADLVALSKAIETVRKPLLSRKELPKDLAHQMFWFVSAALRHTILDRFSIDAKELDGVFAQILDEKAAEVAAATRSNASTWRTGEVNALVAKVRAGDVPGFTKAMALLIGIDVATATKIVSDNGGEPLAIACKAMGADRSQFTTIFLQLDYKRFGKARPISHVQDVSKVFDALSTDKARATMTLWNAQGAMAA